MNLLAYSTSTLQQFVLSPHLINKRYVTPARIQPGYTTPTNEVILPSGIHAHSFRTTKLAPKLLGPYMVQHQTKNKIHCIHQHLNTSHVFYASKLSPYIGNPSDAKHIGLLDSDEYIIEAVLVHKGNWKSLPFMTFLVHWYGYDNIADSWEPWQALRKTDALHTYHRSNNLGKYMPLIYRNRNPKDQPTHL